MKTQTMETKFSLQQGSVLVIALFIVAVITAVSIRFVEDFQLSSARSGQDIIHTQLQQLLYSVESFASWTLIEDAKSDSANGLYMTNGVEGSYDFLLEDWTTPLQVPVDEVSIKSSMTDALSRFNLNQLAGRPTGYNPNGVFSQRFTNRQKRFVRLLQTHPDSIVDTELAKQITEAVIDWIDADNTPSGAGGAENNYYNSQEPAYHAANRLFISVTELRQIQGITPEIYDYLRTVTTALPNNTGININTALIAVMRSLNQPNIEIPLTEQEGQRLMSNRPNLNNVAENNTTPQSAYESVNDFLSGGEAAVAFGTDEELLPPADGLRTGSQYFIVEAEATLIDYHRRQISMLKRETVSTGFKVSVIRRTREQL